MSSLLSRRSVTSSFRIHSLMSALPGWLEKIVFVLLCWQFAGLFWVLFAPKTENSNLIMPRQSTGQSIVNKDAFLRWYGTDGKTGSDTSGEYQLVAVIAGKNGAAVLKRGDGSSVAVRVGSEIRPGSRLIAIEPNQITYEQAGVRHEIKLPQRASPPLFSNVQQQVQPTQLLPPVKMSRGQMASIIQGGNLSGWDKGLSSVPEGGIRVENTATQTLAKMLQLKNGDILKSINLRPLEQLSDISLIFHFFGQQSSVDLVIVRNGTTLTQHYEIQP